MKVMALRYQLILLIAIPLIVFYPAVFAEISLVDDSTAFQGIMNSDDFSLRGIFIPKVAGGGYYRPFIGLSYYADKMLWFMDSKAMHLDNILMHVLNVVLLFLLARKVLGKKSEESYVPLTAALLFGLHPITTESVNWISGRTDLMAANFVLSSAICFYSYLQKKSVASLCLTLFFFLCSICSKEAAFGFLPAALIIFAANRGTNPDDNERDYAITSYDLYLFLAVTSISVIIALFIGNYWLIMALGGIYQLMIIVRRRRSTVGGSLGSFVAYCAILTITVGLFFTLRRMAFTSDIDKISQTLKLIFEDTSYAISVFLGAAAFYVKKVLQPLPINFYIREIDPLYSLAGVPLFFFCIALFNRRSNYSALFLSGICLVLPALPFAFGTIAWTAYAERYAYISAAFWILSCCLFIEKYLSHVAHDVSVKYRSLFVLGLVCLLLVVTIITFHRNMTWQTNLKLIEDTVNQTPESKPLRGIYMLAYAKQGNTVAAKEQYYIANSLYSLQYDEKFDVNMAGILESEGKHGEAESFYNKAIEKTKGKSVIALSAYLDYLGKPHAGEDRQEPNKRYNPLEKQIEICRKLYNLNHDPFLLYRLGQFSLAVRHKNEALDYFSRAAKALPPGSEYHTASLKLVSGISK
jgi:hypothetical protein